MKITYLGHSAFEIETNNKKILIDPFLICAPNHKVENITDIFVTHGHGDHLGGSIGMSQKTGAPITAVFELANYCSASGVNTNACGLGAWKEYSWGRAILVPAFHSSSTPDGKYAGCPCGFVFDIEGKKVYHAGDTCLNSEMKVIGELYKPDISLLPIGGTFTMDVEHAVIASEWLNTSIVIPMHYNTFDAINADTALFKSELEKKGITPVILSIGKSLLSDEILK